MEIKTFIKSFADQFDESDKIIFTEKTKFRELEEWSSLMALAIIAMVDEQYDIKLKGDDIRNSMTIEDLYKIVNSRK